MGATVHPRWRCGLVLLAVAVLGATGCQGGEEHKKTDPDKRVEESWIPSIDRRSSAGSGVPAPDLPSNGVSGGGSSVSHVDYCSGIFQLISFTYAGLEFPGTGKVVVNGGDGTWTVASDAANGSGTFSVDAPRYTPIGPATGSLTATVISCRSDQFEIRGTSASGAVWIAYFSWLVSS